MQKRSHLLLARTLLKAEGGFSVRWYELAFLLGSFQPDCNPFTYLKGSLHHRKFGGHTYENARNFIHSHIQCLQGCQRWNLWRYYTLGKLTHYLADAFTYPHNTNFSGNGWAHHCYEKELRLYLKEYLAANSIEQRKSRSDLPKQVEALHQQYMNEEPDMERDVCYILAATALVMTICRRKEKIVEFTEKKAVIYQ